MMSLNDPDQHDLCLSTAHTSLNGTKCEIVVTKKLAILHIKQQFYILHHPKRLTRIPETFTQKHYMEGVVKSRS